MQRPAADKRRKNDRNDAEFLARQLLAHNVVEVFVPDGETEAARSLSRVLEDIRDDLTRAKHRLTHLLIRWGHAWDERTPEGKRRGTWTRAHWEWIRGIELPESAAQESLDYYISDSIPRPRCSQHPDSAALEPGGIPSPPTRRPLWGTRTSRSGLRLLQKNCRTFG